MIARKKLSMKEKAPKKIYDATAATYLLIRICWSGSVLVIIIIGLINAVS